MSNYFEEARTEACTFLGRELTDAEWTEALPAAQQKLVSIISRYGDSQGDRLAPYYLGKLAEEYITAKALATYCAAAAQKKKTASEEIGLDTTTNLSYRGAACQA